MVATTESDLELKKAIISRASPKNLDAEATIDRVVLDVSIGDRTEVVCINMRGNEVRCLSSDGEPDGPFAKAALRFLAAQGRRFRDSGAPEPAPVVNLPGPPTDAQELRRALDDLVTTLCRVGLNEAPDSPSVDDAIDHVIEVAPTPTPLALARWLGRLQQAIAQGHASALARLIDGAARSQTADPGQSSTKDQPLAMWLDATFTDESGASLIVDRTLVEVGREWLYAARGTHFERRYLIDARTGEIYREDRRRAQPSSLGSCPRQVDVGLARVYSGVEPRPVHLLQYAVRPVISATLFERIEQFSNATFSDVCTRYRNSLTQSPALAEPFVVLRPQELLWTDPLALVDRHGNQIPLNESEVSGVYAYAKKVFAQGHPAWIAGRLVDHDGLLSIVPLGAAISSGASLAFRRLI